ncbi:MAG TPA: hypothetical protein PK156_39120 [Polyangium sp.]|nr:hypothetical protein [Polyangium sp.]
MVRRVILGSAVLGSLLAVLVAAHGCGLNVANLGSDCDPAYPLECCRCPWPEDCEPGGTPVDIPDWCWALLDGGTDSGDAGEATDGDTADGESAACSGGTCAAVPEGWKPVVLASGAFLALPDCPSFAPSAIFDGLSARGPDPTCPTCSCDTPVGACKPPETWTVGSSACVGNDVWTNFNPPAKWDGSCTSNTALVEGILCGGKPCVASITISAPVIEEEPCVARTDVPPIDIPKLKADGNPYSEDGRACSGFSWPTCAKSGEVCVPSTPEPFAACIMHEGDVLCPNGWSSKQVLYGGIDDQRFCSPCSCLPSTGATCSMKVQLFSDAACLTTELEVNISLDMGENCFPLMTGVALAGKSADVLEYQPGACEPNGGELTGDLVLEDARTFCCRTSTL